MMAPAPFAMHDLLEVPRKKPPRPQTNFTKFGGITLIVMSFIFVALGSFNYWSGATAPAHELFTVRIEPEIVRASADGHVDIVVKTFSIRREACPATIYRTFFSMADNVIVYSTMMIGGAVPANGKVMEFPMPMRLPAEKFPPGEYGYAAFAINNCEDGRVIVASTGIAKFNVVK